MNIWNIAQQENHFVKTKKEAKKVLDDSVARALQKHPITLDIKLIHHIVNHTLYLKQWEKIIVQNVPTPQHIVDTYCKQPNIIRTVIDGFKHGCVQRHPVFCELIGMILHHKWLDTSYTKKVFQVVNKTVHTMVVFEALVRYAITDAKFLKCVIDFYSFMKWKKYKNNYELLSKLDKESLFALVKAESVDWCLTQYLQMCEVRDSHSFTKKQKEDLYEKIGERCAFGLDTNIYEAVFGDKVINTDYSVNNATAGTNGLLLQPYGRPTLENGVMVFNGMEQTYMSMYTSWNLCFICKYTSAPLLYAKLFQPFVLDAEPKYFMFRRAISLLFTVQSTMCNILYSMNNKDQYDVSKIHLTFSKLNLAYGTAMMQHIHGYTSYWYKTKLFFKNVPYLARKLVTLFQSKPLEHMNSRKQYTRKRSSVLYKELTRQSLKRPYKQVRERSRSASRTKSKRTKQRPRK